MDGQSSGMRRPLASARMRDCRRVPSGHGAGAFPILRDGRGMPMDERQLVMELTGSNRATALAECIRRYGPMVKRTAWRITADEHLAEDVCQAAFLVLMRKAGSLKEANLLGAWLYRVAVLAARKVVEGNVRRQNREQEAGMLAQAKQEPIAKLPTGIDKAIDGLPEIYRRVIVAHYLEGRSHAEVAAQLGVSADTVKKRGTRGIDRLRKLLARTVPGISVAALGTMLAAEAAAAQATAFTGAQVTAIQAAAVGTASAHVTGLAAAATKALLWAKLKVYGAIMASVAVVAVPAYVILKPTEGLVGHYTFAEGSGKTVKDASPTGNHGTLVGGVTWTAGRKPGSKALDFDGKTGYVKVSQDLNQWLGGTATVAFWINTKQVGLGFPPVCIAGVDIVASTDDVQWGFLDDSGRIGVNAGDLQVVNMAKSAQPINDGQWHHVALTRNAVLGQSQVFVDGKLSSSTATGAKGSKTTPFFSIARKEVFPNDSKDKTVYYFQGLLEDVRLYNRVLSPAEIDALAK